MGASRQGPDTRQADSEMFFPNKFCNSSAPNSNDTPPLTVVAEAMPDVELSASGENQNDKCSM
jgi:hypothetical protein